ncbi:hypothetical protein [Komagataeibacter diospyri]|uniref:Uncharacterized protein n=1 Tax=Komagataeibacter diospyri TaxID=1932662 RepID=A0A4P5NZM6_9PROT|nr:hypothetical protein [Komagataeibacter diospyri]GCE85115.1 hypothetical protein MSKU9_3256 [Komagataeibacter diospyri]
MRSREEQIADLTNLFGEEGTFSFVDDRDAATKHIIVAERRAEQRVREAIARDSERLDWLAECCIHAYAPKQYQRGVGCGVCLVSHVPEIDRNLRAAIDAAREAQG